MAKEPSFDVVSQVDMQEVSNALNQTTKEIQKVLKKKRGCNTHPRNQQESIFFLLMYH